MKNKYASVLAPVKKILCPDIWDPDGHVYPHIKKFIIQQAIKLLGHDFSELVMIGTSVGYQWSFDSDIDVNVRIPDWKLTDELNQKRKEMNGALAPGTKHPVNLFLQAIPEDLSTSWQDVVFGAYDLLHDVWLAKPKTLFHVPPTEFFRLELYTAKVMLDEFIRLTNEYHKKVKLREDYEKFLEDKRTSNLWELNKDYYNTKLENLKTLEQEALFKVYMFVRDIDQARKLEYDLGWGIPRTDWRNIIFKTLEGSEYSDFFEYIKELNLIPKPSISDAHPGIYENTTF